MGTVVGDTFAQHLCASLEDLFYGALCLVQGPVIISWAWDLGSPPVVKIWGSPIRNTS